MSNFAVTSINSQADPGMRLLLVDASVSGSSPLAQAGFKNLFQIHTTCLATLEKDIFQVQPHVIMFDFDFPDREGLGIVRDIKRDWPSIPLLMATLQHSERLAVWALRARLWDYYVKPLQSIDYERMHAELLAVQRLPNKRNDQRIAIDKNPSVPVDARFAPYNPKTKLALAVNYVKENLDAGLCSKAIEQLTGMNFQQFSRQFRHHYDINFQAFVTEKRMEEAARLLANPHVSIADVAFTVGYRDTSYFSRMFRKHYKLTPSTFRERSLQAPAVDDGAGAMERSVN